jgi:hypothetical protein
MHFFFLIYYDNQTLQVSNRLTVHHQELALLYVQHLVFIVLKIYLEYRN